MFSIPTNVTRTEVKVSSVKEGEIIYTSNASNAKPYLVLQVGHPFLLLENLQTHWASLYHADSVYKDVPNDSSNF